MTSPSNGQRLNAEPPASLLVLTALKMEARFDKHTILESYFNAVYYGHGAYGIGAASSVYFHEPPMQL